VKIYHENSVFVKIGPTSILAIFVTCQASSETMSTVHAVLYLYILHGHYIKVKVK